MKILSDIEVNQNILKQPRIDVRASAPTSPAPKEAQMYYDSAEKVLKYYNGTQWVSWSNEAVNVQILSADKTLTASDPPIQILSTSLVRTVTLPTTGLTMGQKFIIFHNGTDSGNQYIIVRDANRTYSNLYSQARIEFRWDGTKWLFDNKDNINIGVNAQGSNMGIAIGANANGNLYGTTIGNYANGSNNGFAGGLFTNGSNVSTAIGYTAITNSKQGAIACGPYAKAIRVGEFALSGDFVNSLNNNTRFTILRFHTWASNPYGAILMLNGEEDGWYEILPKHIISGDMRVHAMFDEDHVKAWRIRYVAYRGATDIDLDILENLVEYNLGMDNVTISFQVDNYNHLLYFRGGGTLPGDTLFTAYSLNLETKLSFSLL